MSNNVYSFAAVVGQQLVKKAILLSIINPKLSPVLLRGFRGTGKSTIVKSLQEIVPDIESVTDCEYNCAPNDKENYCHDCRNRESTGTLQSQVKPMPIVYLSSHNLLFAKKFKTIDSWATDLKILAGANRGILVVEKLNLYNERLINSLLTFSIKGFKKGESGKMSSFVFIATINVEDGELSPDIYERFALSVNVSDIADIEERIEITKRGMDYRKNPDSFQKRFNYEHDKLKKKIVKAREDLQKIDPTSKVGETVTALCKKFKIRGTEDIIMQAAITNAAYEGKRYITIDDVKEILDITIAHKL